MKVCVSKHVGGRALEQVPILLCCVLLFLLAVCSVALAGISKPPEVKPDVRVLEMDGTIDPLSARYLERELRNAASAAFVVIRLDTPGGLESSMREITQMLLASPTPVVVYVSPAGARAASAGLFVMLAANVAAMAPGTNIGAAHPVAIGTETDKVRTDKAVNDAAALARAVAQTRGRNVAWAEQAVRESLSITEEEALRET
jgi:membrane-bound serine protease (ClpP class)